MSRTCFRLSCSAFAAVIWLPTAAIAAESAQLCLDAIQKAARSSSVPYELLLAVAITESGRQAASEPAPWPWALNQGGESLWFESSAQALKWVDAAIARGVTNIDLGCFQLNWRWHGEQFASTAEMIDPVRNAEYAAKFLGDLKVQTGSWEKAVAGYHSFTPELADRYMKRFRPIYAAVQEGITDTPLLTAATEPVRTNSYPLLQMGTERTAGSLVTVSGGLRPLIGAQ